MRCWKKSRCRHVSSFVRQPRNPRVRTRRRRTGSRAESPHTKSSRPSSTANSLRVTVHGDCNPRANWKRSGVSHPLTINSIPNRSLPKRTQKTALPTPFSEEPTIRAFYVGDNPVARHNRFDFAPYGKLGFALKGIQVYLPLSSELTLCAYCPSIISEGIEENRILRNQYRLELQKRAVQGIITFTELSEPAAAMERNCENVDRLKEHLSKGLPIDSAILTWISIIPYISSGHIDTSWTRWLNLAWQRNLTRTIHNSETVRGSKSSEGLTSSVAARSASSPGSSGMPSTAICM